MTYKIDWSIVISLILIVVCVITIIYLLGKNTIELPINNTIEIQNNTPIKYIDGNEVLIFDKEECISHNNKWWCING